MKHLPKNALLLALLAISLAAGATYLFKPSKPLTWPEALEQYIGAPAYKSVDPAKPLHEQTSVFETAGRVFEMPIVYIQSNLAGKRQQPDGVNLIYVLPEYKTRADFASRQEYEHTRKAGHFGHMLIEPEAVRPSFDVMVANMQHSVTKVETAGISHGLEREHWYRQYGEKLEFTYDVFLEKNAAGHVVSWIECSTEDSAVVPHCSHKFRDKALLYSIHYHKANYLDAWREQRVSAIKFIDSFEIKNKTNNQKKELDHADIDGTTEK